jgi:hypothetical protein
MEQIQQASEEDVINKIVGKWIEYSSENPDISAGTWLRSFAIMSGMTLGISGTSEEFVQPAMQEFVNLAVGAYHGTIREIPPATIQ